jgi:hypothetical protein
MTLPRALGGSELDPLEQFAVCADHRRAHDRVNP